MGWFRGRALGRGPGSSEAIRDYKLLAASDMESINISIFENTRLIFREWRPLRLPQHLSATRCLACWTLPSQQQTICSSPKQSEIRYTNLHQHSKRYNMLSKTALPLALLGIVHATNSVSTTNRRSSSANPTNHPPGKSPQRPLRRPLPAQPPNRPHILQQHRATRLKAHRH